MSNLPQEEGRLIWITSVRGFYSAVQHRDHRDQLLVRARARADLERLLELLPGNDAPEIIEFPRGQSDYRYRIQIDKGLWAQLVGTLLTEIDYDNFKNAVKAQMPEPEGKRRAAIYMRVWQALLSITRDEDGGPPAQRLFPELPTDDEDVHPTDDWLRFPDLSPEEEDWIASMGEIEPSDFMGGDGAAR